MYSSLSGACQGVDLACVTVDGGRSISEGEGEGEAMAIE